MKNKFVISMALALAIMPFNPMSVDAEWYASPTNNGAQAGTAEATTSTGRVVKVASGSSALDNEEPTIVITNVADAPDPLTSTIHSKIDSTENLDAFIGEFSGLKDAITAKVGDKNLLSNILFDVSVNSAMIQVMEKSETVTFTVKVDGVKSGDTYLAIHFIGENSAELIPCVAGDNSVTLTMSGFSPILLVKAETKETSKTETTTNSGTKVVTCEEANGKNWVWSEKKQECVYNVSNTSAK